MRIHSDLADTIGNTPLLKLKRASELTGCTILGKCEFLNPGQSVKDRAALYMIRDAVAKGLLKPGGIYVIDDLMPQPGWPAGQEARVATILANLDARADARVARLAWASDIAIAVKSPS